MLIRPFTNLLDLALAAWVCVWIAIGVAVGVEVARLSELSKTVVKEGLAVHTVGTSLRSLGGVPVIGAPIASDAKAVQAAGASAVANGSGSESTISALSVLLAIAIAVLPTAPVVLLYVPARLQRRRDAAAVRQALRGSADGADLQEFLAQQAQHTLGYHRLRRLGVPLGAPLSQEDINVLADAELRRLQIAPRALRSRIPHRA